MILEADVDKKKWKFFVQYMLSVCDEVSFNVLYKGKDYDLFINSFSRNELSHNQYRNTKIYPSGDNISFKLTDDIRNLLLTSNYLDWKNNFITDPSFHHSGYELAASVIHEDYIIFNDNFKDDNHFIKNGFLMNNHIKDFGYEGLSLFKWIKNFFKN